MADLAQKGVLPGTPQQQVGAAGSAWLPLPAQLVSSDLDSRVSYCFLPRRRCLRTGRPAALCALEPGAVAGRDGGAPAGNHAVGLRRGGAARRLDRRAAAAGGGARAGRGARAPGRLQHQGAQQPALRLRLPAAVRLRVDAGGGQGGPITEGCLPSLAYHCCPCRPACRQPTPESRAYGAVLAGELLQRFGAQPYVRSAFTSADFADLAQTCAALFGSSSPAAQPASGGGSSSGGGVAGPPSEPLPAEVVRLLDELAGEVRRQLGNKSSRSPWAPRDLVRITR